MERMVQKSIIPILIIISIIGVSIMSAIANRQYWLLSLVFVGFAITPFFIRYERKEIQIREIMMMVMLIAVAAVSRVPFTAIPSVLPMTFVIIASAIVFGAERGFMIGALSAIVSNIFIGQGPWTPWQMLCWGMIGFFAGLLKDTWWMKKLWGKAVFGFISGIIFGWIMNLSTVITIMSEFSWEVILAAYAASFIFDLLHASFNIIFILLFANTWIRILQRFKKKYGI